MEKEKISAERLKYHKLKKITEKGVGLMIKARRVTGCRV